MPTVDDLAKVAYVTYTGPQSPKYGPNDPNKVWDTLAPENKQVWERVVKAVVKAAMN